MRWSSLSNCGGNCYVVTGCKGTEVGKCGYQSYAEGCELLIIWVHMTYISVIWLQIVYILVCVLCTVCILCTEGRQYAQFRKFANCCVITVRRAAKVGWCWTGRETEVDRWGDWNYSERRFGTRLDADWCGVVLNTVIPWYMRTAHSAAETVIPWYMSIWIFRTL